MKKDIPILIDFDGVIRLGSGLAADAFEFLNFLHSENLPFIIITNSTRDSSDDLKNILAHNGVGFNVNIMTTVDATIEYIKEKNLSVSVYCIKNIRHRFEEFINDKDPRAVVIGDLGTGWSYGILNEIFNKVYGGAEIIAMQKNKFWKPDGIELALDAGAFITAIEYASGKNSVLIGKPSPIYFHTAIKMPGCPAGSPFLMIGDDLENDIKPAQELGGKGILLYTGKTKFPLRQDSKIHPDYDAKNLTDVIELLKDILQ
ncbi:MAG: HAD hydrolase-like protein [Ignavibacteriaceae bacterium]|jgi:HAD superfamily hydrolase (TIGR01458 family)